MDEILERDEDKNNDGDTLDSGDPGNDDETLYYIQDHNWNVVTLCGESGSPVERVLYDPFGEPSFFDGSYNAASGSNYGNRVLFTGRLWSWTTSYGTTSYTYDYRLREYSPYLGRFLQRDPIGIWGDETNWGNGYAYVGNEPVNKFDFLGLLGACDFCGGGICGFQKRCIQFEWGFCNCDDELKEERKHVAKMSNLYKQAALLGITSNLRAWIQHEYGSPLTPMAGADQDQLEGNINVPIGGGKVVNMPPGPDGLEPCAKLNWFHVYHHEVSHHCFDQQFGSLLGFLHPVIYGALSESYAYAMEGVLISEFLDQLEMCCGIFLTPNSGSGGVMVAILDLNRNPDISVTQCFSPLCSQVTGLGLMRSPR